MSMHLDDIPTIAASGRLGRHVPDLDEAYQVRPDGPGELLSSFTLGSRTDMRRLLEGGLTPAALGRALRGGGSASAVSYSMYGDCGPFAGYGGTCNEACFGFEPHHMDPFYCGTCAEQAADPANNPAYFWHFVGSRGSIQVQGPGARCVRGPRRVEVGRGGLRQLPAAGSVSLPRRLEEVPGLERLGSDDLSGPRGMRRTAEDVPVAPRVLRTQHVAHAVTVAAAVAAVSLQADAALALAVGVTAGLSLSGSV